MPDTQYESQFDGLLKNFISIYQSLNVNNIDLLARVYDTNIVFKDPLHVIEGLDALKAYMANMYASVSDYAVEIHELNVQGDIAYVKWAMQFCHPKLNAGQQIAFEGVSRLQLADKIIHHQDFFDVGAMLYEHIPVLGTFNKYVKRQAGK